MDAILERREESLVLLVVVLRDTQPFTDKVLTGTRGRSLASKYWHFCYVCSLIKLLLELLPSKRLGIPRGLRPQMAHRHGGTRVSVSVTSCVPVDAKTPAPTS